MGWKELVIFFSCIVIVSLLGCNNFLKNYYTNEEGGNRPKKSKFTLNTPSYNLTKGDLIDTVAVYVNKTEMYYGEKTHIDFHYLRFFKNGQYMEDLVSKKEDLNLLNFNNVNNSLMIGYFNIQNKKYIQLEYFRVKYGEGGFYDKRQGYIKNDSIFLFYKEYDKNDFPIPNKKNCRIYIKEKVEGLTGTPDW
ncbi:hypothetical protein [Aquimarina sediminis]|uniref:hypothetical protein n=1 Tax=Aquimarina sediminis TaxID=2070536 RepID=UPI000CA06E6E|nr:hypothetical protein [Aquimarina sediminis]